MSWLLPVGVEFYIFSRSKQSLYCSLAYSRWLILVFSVFRFVNMLDVNH